VFNLRAASEASGPRTVYTVSETGYDETRTAGDLIFDASPAILRNYLCRRQETGSEPVVRKYTETENWLSLALQEDFRNTA